MIDRMPYWDAVIQCTIYWALALIGVWIWNYFNSQKEFTNNRKFLRKKNAVVQIIDKSRGRFSLFENEITTNVEGGLRFLKVDKEQSQNFMIGDHLEIEYEEHTKTIFKMTKAKNIQD